MPQQGTNPQQPGGPPQSGPRPQLNQPGTQIRHAQFIAGGARLSIPTQLLSTAPLVQVTRIGNVAGQSLGAHAVAVGPKTQIQIPKLSVGKDQTASIHTVSLGQGDTPVTSGSPITHLLSAAGSTPLVTPLGQHVSLGQTVVPQRVTIQTMSQQQQQQQTQQQTQQSQQPQQQQQQVTGTVSTVTLPLTQASSTQPGGLAGHQHVQGIVSNQQMASIICSSKGPRLTNQPTQLLQAFPSTLPRGQAKPLTGSIIRASTTHTATATAQQGTTAALLSHFPARGPIITPIRTATISNRPNSPAAPPPSTGLSITVPSSQLTGADQKFRTLSGPGMEINLQNARGVHVHGEGSTGATRPVLTPGGPKTIQLAHHGGGQKIVMATTAMPPGSHASHASITVAITKPLAGSHIVASALLPSNVTTVTTASALAVSSQPIPIAKVTPQRFTQMSTAQDVASSTATSSTANATLSQGATLYLPPRVVTSTTALTSATTTTTDGLGTKEPRSVSQMIQYSFGGHQYEAAPHYQTMAGTHFQLSATSQPSTAVRSTLVTAQPAITVAPAGGASLSLQAATSSGGGGNQRVNQVVVMDQNRQIQVRSQAATALPGSTLHTVHIPLQQAGQPLQPQSPSHAIPQSPSSGTPSASPRPSILRKRANDSAYPVVSKKALPFTLDPSRPEQVSSPKQQQQQQHLLTSMDAPREASQSSTDTASSQDGSTNSTPTTCTEMKVKLENPDEEPTAVPHALLREGTGSSVEASPRKKPRKQLLQANEELKDEVMNSSSSDEDDEMQEEPVPPTDPMNAEIKEEIKEERVDEEGVRWVAYRKRPDFSLMNHYSCTWKTKNNHFLRHNDVRAKDERRPTVNELSNQKQIQQKASGWRLYHLAAQLDDLVKLEWEGKQRMAALQEALAPSDGQHKGQQYLGAGVDDVTMIHELTQANVQRSQLIVDQMSEARQSMINLLSEHRTKIDEILTKHRSRRPVKSKARM